MFVCKYYFFFVFILLMKTLEYRDRFFWFFFDYYFPEYKQKSFHCIAMQVSFGREKMYKLLIQSLVFAKQVA